MNGNHGRRQAFSLIEVLIAILILALGLLGLGALFPVVIRQQRIGTEAVMGVLVANSARVTVLQSHWEGGLPMPLPNGVPDIWTAIRDHAGGLNSVAYENGRWLIPEVADNNSGAIGRGDMFLGVPTDVNQQVRVPLVSRLYPVGMGDEGQPQFVWDIAVQRIADFIDDNPSSLDAVRVALFVRRIDPRIRVDRDRTLLGVLTDPATPGAQQRVPVGATTNDPDMALPTFDGTDGSGNPANHVYSKPIRVEAEFYYDIVPSSPRFHADRLYFPNSVTATQWAMLKQIRQQLVDNLGNVYTVVGDGVEPGVGNGRYLKIDPPVPASIRAETKRQSGGLSNQLLEVVFTPQIPASVVVMEVKR